MKPLHVFRARRPGIAILVVLFCCAAAAKSILNAADDPTARNVFIALLVGGFAWTRFFMPQRLEIFPNRLRLAFLIGHLDVPFETIEVVQPGRWWHVWFYWGLRFATMPRRVIEVKRKGLLRLNFVISTWDRDLFLTQLEATRRAFEAGTLVTARSA